MGNTSHDVWLRARLGAWGLRHPFLSIEYGKMLIKQWILRYHIFRQRYI